MSRLALAVFVGLAVLPVSFADPPKAESLKEFVDKNKSRHAVGIYLQGKKVGYMISELKLDTRNGVEVAVETSEMLLSLSADGEKTSTTEREEIHYALDGEGAIVAATVRSMQDKEETLIKAAPSARGLMLTTVSAGTTQKREIPTPKSTIANARALTNWLRAGPDKGATFDHWGTSWPDEIVDSKETFAYQGKKSIVWGGVRTDVYLVKINMKGAIFDAEVLANGDPIRGKLGGLLELRAESEEIARKLDKGSIDMVAASSIKIDRNLGLSPLVKALTLEVDGLADFTLPASHRQATRRENGKTYLDLKADFRVAQGAPLTEAEIKKFTQATPAIQSDAEEVRSLAAKIVGQETDPLKRARLLKSWVYKKLRKTMACNSSTTLGVLKNMAGDCTEHTLLFVSLARALGLPARELTGVAHVDQIFGWHAWAEVHDGHQWVSVDPTWDELYVDATHIVFSHDSDDHSWLNVLGNLSFKAIKVERKKD
jgi:hypothetical protein